MMLWRKKNSFDELVEIVKLMDFLSGEYQGSYPHPHGNVKYPINKDTLTGYLTTLDEEIERIYGSQQNHNLAKELIDERKTQMLSGWVMRSCRYGRTNCKTQFIKAREAYAYFKRLE
jgi:hypothetical protein